MTFPVSAETAPADGEKTAACWRRGAFLVVAGATATGAPWMLGGEPVRAEWWLLGGGILTLAMGLWVRWQVPATAESRANWSVGRRVLGLGLVFLVLVGIQTLNPSHRVVLENRLWRLEPLSPVAWAPTSLAGLFDEIPGDGLPFRNAARYLLIFGIACSYASGLALGLVRVEDARRFARLLGVNAVVLAVVCIVHVATGAQLTLWHYYGTFDFSHSPVFFYKNHNGAYLAASLAVVLGLAASAGTRFGRWTWGTLAFVVWTATVMVDSRVATGCATLLGVIYLVRSALRPAAGSRRRWRLARVTVIAIAAAALLITLRDSPAVKRFAPMLTEPADFVQGGSFRVLLREVGYEMWRDRPVWGWGGGSFLYLFNTYHQRVPELAETIYRQQPTLNRLYWPTANCDWIEFAVEYGVAGLALMVGMLWIPLAAWWRARGWRDGLSFFLALGAAVLVTHAWFDYILRNPALLILGATLVLVALRLSFDRGGDVSDGTTSDNI